MFSQFLKKQIKKAKKEKEMVNEYCKICRMGIYKKYIPIRAKAIRREFLRQHNHSVSLKRKIINFFDRR